MPRHPWTCACAECAADRDIDDRRHNRGGPWTPDQWFSDLARFSQRPGRAVPRETPGIGAEDGPDGPGKPRIGAL